MTVSKKLGIWIDHSSAHLIEFRNDPIETKIIASKFTHEDKVNSLINKGENLMHKKEKYLRTEYYNRIGEVIRNYEEVILFGPTDAKVELYNILKADHLFSKIKIDVKNTDKITDTHQHAFVRDYFLKLIDKSGYELSLQKS